MESLSRSFFSMRMMAACMIIFLLAIGAATLLESSYDIQTAKIIVYNALWFEVLLVYLGINLIANIIRHKMFRREKIATLMFHLSFIVILIGAGITRFISFEGLMTIREGEQSNFIYSSDPHVWLRVNDGKVQYTYAEKMFQTELKPFGMNLNNFTIPVEFPKHKTPISIEYVKFEKNMVDSLVVNDSIKGMVIEIMTNGMQPNHLAPGGFLMVGDVALSFEKKDAMPGIQLIRKGSKIMMQSKLPVRYLPMAEMQKARQEGKDVPDSLFIEVPMDSLVQFQTTTLYQTGEQQFVFKQIINHASKMLLRSQTKGMGSDYLTVKITDGKKSKIVQLKGGMSTIPEHEMFNFNGLTYEMEYGSTRIDVPFAIACRDFKLDRYPGSNSPSSFASEVSIVDKEKNYKRDQRIFMNNVMDYRGYRFFQSGYDPDELGTRLSVNHDMWGTNVTYLGYLLMSIGMILSLFASAGRFRALNDLLKKSREKREKLMQMILLAITLVTSQTFAQNNNHEHHEGDGHDHSQTSASTETSAAVFTIMSEKHSDDLASLLVQDYDGRIVPMHTMCDQVLRKVSRDNKYKGNNAVQTVISMHMYPDHWMAEPVIQVSKNLQERYKLKEYSSFMELASLNGDFKWLADYEKSHQKLESKRDEFDKKLIKLVERFQVMQSVFSWQYMRIIPVKNDSNNTWYVPLSMELMQKDTISSSLALAYISGLDKAAKSGDYSDLNQKLRKLKDFQRSVAMGVAPTEATVYIEIIYNKWSIFKNTYRAYLLIGLLLMILFFVLIFTPSKTFKEPKNALGKLLRPIKRLSWRMLKILNRYSKIFRLGLVGLLIVFFVYHGFGLGMRWYVSGHAPWSNGYEAMVFIAWITMVAGFIFTRNNPVILAGTAILAALMIFVTEMNLMDPEITPLQPVLKSYWLMIHVAIITSSYGFLGLACILGFFNQTLYIFRSKENGKLLTLNINELTYVSEMTMTIGLFMLTIGTFLGGVWANESWGRYWGWDPKETWALVSVLVYAVILHLRYIPALKGKFLFNALSFWGYSAILFTFFGVNFYLVGLHSYAQGEGLGTVPAWIKVTVLIFITFTAYASIRNKKYSLQLIEDELS